MKIALYKIGTNHSMIENYCKDKNGMFKELLMLRKLLIKFGDTCDLYANTISMLDNYDIGFVLNGVESEDEFEKILSLRKHCGKLGYIMTDLRLKPNAKYENMFDAIYTQTTEQILDNWVPEYYSGMPELAMFEANPDVISNEKDIKFIFGGGLRDRVDSFNKYIELDESVSLNGSRAYRALGLETLECDIYVKDEATGFDNRLPIDQYHMMLDRSMYSILIADEEYNDFGFITWRFFENLARGVITFIDTRCDKYGIIRNEGLIPKVSNSDGLVASINFFEDRNIRVETLKKLFNEYADAISGQTTYSFLMKGVK